MRTIALAVTQQQEEDVRLALIRYERFLMRQAQTCLDTHQFDKADRFIGRAGDINDVYDQMLRGKLNVSP